MNLIALCTVCHDAEHDEKMIDLSDGVSCLLKDVARREGTTHEAITLVMDLLNRLDRKRGGRFAMNGTPLEDELRDLGAARALAERTLCEIGVSITEAA